MTTRLFDRKQLATLVLAAGAAWLLSLPLTAGEEHKVDKTVKLAQSEFTGLKPAGNQVGGRRYLEIKAVQEKMSLRKGETLEIQLEGSPGTGHDWKCVKIEGGSLVSTKAAKEAAKPGDEKAALGDAPERQKQGGSRYRPFAFRAQAAGTTVLEFHYQRLAKELPAQIYQVTVEVD